MASNKSSIFKFKKYRPDILEEYDRAEVRKEYTRLRAIAQKRLKRLGETEFRRDRTYGEYHDYFPPLKDMADVDLPYYLSDLAAWLRRKTSTVRGAREVQRNIISGLKSHDLPVDEDNYRDFIDFLNDIADEQDAERYASDQTALVWREADRLKVSHDQVRKDFKYWYENRHAIETIESKEGGKWSSAEIKKYLRDKRK